MTSTVLSLRSKSIALAVGVLGSLTTGALLRAGDAPAKGTATASADVKIDVGHNDLDHESAEFKFKEVPAPAKTNAATTAKFSIVAGEKDPNGGDLAVLHDGKLPSDQDEPPSNFFFDAGTEGGRILIDLGSNIRVKQVNTYSWHTDTRAPQVYSLYAADGAVAGFDAKPSKDVDPTQAGWTLLAKVDTRPKTGEPGGQYGVSISDTKGSLGNFRYLLIAASRTEADDGFGNTFFSEINVIDANELKGAPADKPGAKKDAQGGPAAVEKSAPELETARTAKEIQAEWTRASRDLNKLMPSPADLLDPYQRQTLAPKVLPVLKTMAALATERGAGNRQFSSEIADDTIRVQACLSYLGDSDTIDSLAALAADTDKPAFLRARLTQQLVAWWRAAKDEKAQKKILGEVQELATASPANGRLYFVLMTMKDIGAATPSIADQAEAIVAETLVGDQPSFVKEVRAGKALRKQALGKPIEFAGKTVDDKDFSSREYMGKVVLIDFWATWCHPCVEENPRLKALYEKYHDKGLEIVGISSDSDAAQLAAYTKQEHIPWVQMWDKKAQAGGGSWHPFTKKWGIVSIPIMFLIDKQGHLRTVDARANMEDMVPKLLDEQATEKSPISPPEQ